MHGCEFIRPTAVYFASECNNFTTKYAFLMCGPPNLVGCSLENRVWSPGHGKVNLLLEQLSPVVAKPTEKWAGKLQTEWVSVHWPTWLLDHIWHLLCRITNFQQWLTKPRTSEKKSHKTVNYPSADQCVASNQFSPSSIKIVVLRQETPVVYLTDWVIQQNADHMLPMT